MARYFGKIGFAVPTETSRGVWTDEIIEREYYGDSVRDLRRFDQSEKINDDIKIQNEISIVADPFAFENFHAIRYVEYLKTKWRVTSIEVNYPRLKLYIGGVYNA